MIGLCFITVVQFIIGFVHIMLLFTTYRPVLLDTCLQRQPSRYFWWSMGYEDNQEMEQIYELCSSQWNRFATERLISWIAYSFFTVSQRIIIIPFYADGLPKLLNSLSAYISLSSINATLHISIIKPMAK